MRSTIEHFYSAYAQCLQLDRVLTSAQEECNGTAQFFPIIVCRRPSLSNKVSLLHSESRTNNDRYSIFAVFPHLETIV